MLFSGKPEVVHESGSYFDDGWEIIMKNADPVAVGDIRTKFAKIMKCIANGGLNSEAVNRGLQDIIDGEYPVLRWPWSSVNTYKGKLHEWNERFAWKIPKEKIDGLEFWHHVSDELPEGITLFFSQNLQENIAIATEVLAYEMEKLGRRFRHNAHLSYCSWLEGSEPIFDGLILEPAHLSLELHDTENGICPKEFRPTKSRWPSLEVYWLMALNPRILSGIRDMETHAILIPGLVIAPYSSMAELRMDCGSAHVSNVDNERPYCDRAAISFRDL